jgi:hypothetical protein
MVPMPARKAYRRTEKAQRTLCYHHCCQRLGSSGFCTDEEIDLDSHVIGEWSVCPYSAVKIKSQLLPEIESRPFKRQPGPLTTSAPPVTEEKVPVKIDGYSASAK